MDIKIELKFTKSISRLAGNSYGQEIYNKQVKDLIDFSGKNLIIIPSHIEDIAISFVQGFTYEIFEKISKDMFFEHISIDANEKIRNKFMKAAFF
ncbi:hypothetical protein G9F73_012445 [Clostridium estertheticum]|uniref:hypothetical protein n=1 Tax=Clostridium estertheticum TaxID=238834 RepID=UPI0013EEBB82|nr:hypothetical protein [Clostridium estertheticum]MBZ9608618.1 hypothetical protein [Clostridium estertheticum]